MKEIEPIASVLEQVIAQQAQKPAVLKSGPSPLSVKFKKTELCRYYPRCSKGDDCFYAHSEAELRVRPNFTKTRMCAGFRDGRCKLPASECPFAHGVRDLRCSENGASAAPKARKQRQKRSEREDQKVDVEQPGLPPPPPGIADYRRFGSFESGQGTLTPTASGASTPKSFGQRSGGSGAWALDAPVYVSDAPSEPHAPADNVADDAASAWLAWIQNFHGNVALGPGEIGARPDEELIVYARLRL